MRYHCEVCLHYHQIAPNFIRNYAFLCLKQMTILPFSSSHFDQLFVIFCRCCSGPIQILYHGYTLLLILFWLGIRYIHKCVYPQKKVLVIKLLLIYFVMKFLYYVILKIAQVFNLVLSYTFWRKMNIWLWRSSLKDRCFSDHLKKLVI